MVLDLLKYAENEQLPGLIVQCDYYKAYDCVEWKYINTVMELVGFGPNFFALDTNLLPVGTCIALPCPDSFE